MSKEQRLTNDLKVPNKDLEVLRANFPHCFDKNGNFQFEKFQLSLSERKINFSTESYGLEWLGKSYARLLASDPASTFLKADATHNTKAENVNSENLLIKGDNLEVLKHLSNAYYEQIRMIYIDPPYNTGSDGFVYQDERKFTVKELQQLIGVDSEKAKRILDFTHQKSNSHSAWLTFLYPRLYIAKQLLKEEGVIFVSIDDNEIFQLKQLMDEIYGEENFIANVPVIMNLKGNQDNFGFADTHEYFLVYAKNKNQCEIYKFNVDEDDVSKQWKEDDYGLFKKADGLRRTGDDASRNRRPKGWFPVFITPDDEIYTTDNDEPKSNKDIILYPINDDNEELSWSWGKAKIQDENYNLIVTEARNGGKAIYKKQRPELGNVPTSKPKSFFYKPEYSTSTATTQLKNLFGKKVFKGPKPKPFIMDLLVIGLGGDDIVLDFFAGSGTTGDAVFQLNANDCGERKFILVQIPEPIDPKNNKEAYHFVTDELKAEATIFEITKERLVRSIRKINADLDDKIEKLKEEISTEKNKTEIKRLEKAKAKNNFKVIETIPIWEDYDFESIELNPQTILFDESKLNEDDINTLLTTWKTYDGIALTQDLDLIDLSGYTANYGNGKLYLMHKGFTIENLKTLLEKIDSDKTFNPTTIITFGYHFESKNLRELSENVKSYSNKKNIDVEFITRY